MIVPGVALLKKGNENPTCAESVPVVRNSQPANANTMRRTQRFMRNNWISIIKDVMKLPPGGGTGNVLQRRIKKDNTHFSKSGPKKE